MVSCDICFLTPSCIYQQFFDSFPCITWQMPVPLFSCFCRGIECLFTLYSAKIFIFLVTTKYSSSE